MNPESAAEMITNLPAAVQFGLASVPAYLVPTTRRAIGRLIVGVTDIPVAGAEQIKLMLEAWGRAKVATQDAITAQAVRVIEADEAVGERAAVHLMGRQYRRQQNREKVAIAAIEDLTTHESAGEQTAPPNDIDEDWLNIFERYAEDASAEELQKLWGRVLSGKIRKPDQYSRRTLRFLSEFSQSDALMFEEFARNAFAGIAPNQLVRPDPHTDMRHLIQLEACGLIENGGALPYSLTLNFEEGFVSFREGELAVVMYAEKNIKVSVANIPLTDLGLDLLELIPNRDKKDAARRVVNAIRRPEIKSAHMGYVDASNNFHFIEELWSNEVEETKAVDEGD